MCIILLKFLAVLYKLTQLISLFIEPKSRNSPGFNSSMHCVGPTQ